MFFRVWIVAVPHADVVLSIQHVYRGDYRLIQTWYLVRRVLQTPVTSIMVTSKGTSALGAII